MDDFKVPVETVSAYFNGLARRGMFDEIVVIGRYSSDAKALDDDNVIEDGYAVYIASSTTNKRTLKLMKDATKEWLDG